MGHERVVGELATFVRDPAVPMVHDANHGAAVTAESAAEIDRVLALADELLASRMDRSFELTPGVPPAFEARLALGGYRSSTDLQMVLEGPLRAHPPEVDIRTIAADADWDALRILKRAADEEDRGRTTEAWPVALGDQIFRSMRAKAPAVPTFSPGSRTETSASSRPGPATTASGVVEDLFTLPSHRRRGVATALIDRAVADARARGAEQVLIGADPADTPKGLYAALGFRPLLMMRGYWRSFKEG